MNARHLIACLTLLAACGDKDATTDDSSPSGDTAPEFHPLVPDGYEFRWDTDGCGDSNEDTQVYQLAEASSDANGNLTVTERWYWFFGGDWSDDCVDTIQYTGSAVADATLSNLGASEAEEGYDMQMVKTDEGCPQMNYLAIWDHPDKDDFEYGDELNQRVIVVFDTLSPSGNLNYENAMLVFMGYEGRSSTFTMSYDYATGVFNPESDILGPPAQYTWEGSSCLGSGG